MSMPWRGCAPGDRVAARVLTEDGGRAGPLRQAWVLERYDDGDEVVFRLQWVFPPRGMPDKQRVRGRRLEVTEILAYGERAP